jgi:small conductance mechanosensitive channel
VDALQAQSSVGLNPQCVGELLLSWSGRLVGAAAIFVIGRLAAHLLAEWFGRAVQRVGMDQTLARFFASLIYLGLLLFVTLTALGALGVPMLNFVALLGAAGLAVGLALKDSLSNFSSGVMLVFFRPFRVGDTVSAAGVTGTVDTIGMFSTVIKTADNVVITVPNSLVYAGTIQNFTAERARRLDFTVWTRYDDPTEVAIETIRELASADERVLAQPPPEVVVHDLAANGVFIAVRLWAATTDLGAVRGDLLARIHGTLAQLRERQLAKAK